jgi:hypothetical protein
MRTLKRKMKIIRTGRESMKFKKLAPTLENTIISGGRRDLETRLLAFDMELVPTIIEL